MATCVSPQMAHLRRKCLLVLCRFGGELSVGSFSSSSSSTLHYDLMRAHAVLVVCALACACAMAAPTNSMAPVTKPTTMNNGQPACVQFGDCTKSNSDYQKTEKYSSAITSPASHSVPYLSDASASEAYKASIASAGGAAAYDPQRNPASSTPVPPPTTVSFDTSVTTSGSTVYTHTQMDGAVAHVVTATTFTTSILAAVATVFFVGAVAL